MSDMAPSHALRRRSENQGLASSAPTRGSTGTLWRRAAGSSLAAANLLVQASRSATVCGAAGSGTRLAPNVKPAARKQKPIHGLLVHVWENGSERLETVAARRQRRAQPKRLSRKRHRRRVDQKYAPTVRQRRPTPAVRVAVSASSKIRSSWVRYGIGSVRPSASACGVSRAERSSTGHCENGHDTAVFRRGLLWPDDPAMTGRRANHATD
jgi:hypothetical protein